MTCKEWNERMPQLRDKFKRGEITKEQYEEALDQLYRELANLTHVDC